MNKYIFGLLGLALLGGSTLLGQTPQAGKKGEPIPAPVKGTPASEACCQGGCCPKTKTVCCPEHYVKEKEKVVYSSGCEKKCVTYCHGLFCGCGDCDKGHCGHPHRVKYLVKKVQVCDHDAVKCVPVDVPACTHGHGCASGACCGNQAAISPAVVPVTQPVSAVVPTAQK